MFAATSSDHLFHLFVFQLVKMAGRVALLKECQLLHNIFSRQTHLCCYISLRSENSFLKLYYKNHQSQPEKHSPIPSTQQQDQNLQFLKTNFHVSCIGWFI